MMKPFKLLIPIAAGIVGLSQIVTSASADTSVELKARVDRPLIVKGGEQRVIIKIDVNGLPAKRKLDRLPLNIALVLDRSGSMTGTKLEQAKQAAEMLVDQLAPGDVFSLVMYDTDIDVLVKAQPIKKQRAEFKRIIRRIKAGGSTALYGGVEEGGAQLDRFFSEEKINRVILLSDGIANVGPSSNRDIARLGQQLARQQMSVTTVGLGDNYNEDLMTALAEASDANYYYVADIEELPNVFEKELGELQSIVAREITVEITFPDGVKPTRFYGRPEKFKNGRGIVKFSTLAGEQSRELIIEAVVDSEKFDTSTTIATVVVNYENTVSKEADQKLNREIVVGFTADTSLAEKAHDKDVWTVAEIYRNADESKKALALADSGDWKGWGSQLKSQITSLNKLKSEAPASRRQAVQKEIDILKQAGADVTSNGLGKSSRKAIQNRVYQIGNSKTAVK